MDIDEHLCDRQLDRNRYYVKSVAGVIQFLAEKELALRGDWDGETEGITP